MERRCREGRTYMRLKRPSRSGSNAKEKADGRAQVGGVSGFPHADAKRPWAPLSLVLCPLCGKCAM